MDRDGIEGEVIRDALADGGRPHGSRGHGAVASRAPVPVQPWAHQRLSVSGQFAIAGLKGIAAQISDLERQLAEQVVEARLCGVSWHLIGWSLGMAADDARERWSTYSSR